MILWFQKQTYMSWFLFFIKVCQVVNTLPFQEFLFQKCKKNIRKITVSMRCAKSKRGFSVLSEIQTLLVTKEFCHWFQQNKDFICVMTILGILMKGFWNAEFSIYVYCLSSNVSLTECCWLNLPFCITVFLEALLKFDASGQSSTFLSLNTVWLLEAPILLNPDHPSQSRTTVLEGSWFVAPQIIDALNLT